LSFLSSPDGAKSAAAGPTSTSECGETPRFHAETFAIQELPDQLQRELNLAGRGLCGVDESRALNSLAILIEDLKVVGWRGKIRAVENIEDLGSELSVKVF
jgi:hypothetical protein